MMAGCVPSFAISLASSRRLSVSAGLSEYDQEKRRGGEQSTGSYAVECEWRGARHALLLAATSTQLSSVMASTLP
jgi:hypothetical protein